MKKKILGILLFALLLSGCAGRENSETDSTAQTEKARPKLWIVSGAVEQQTKGAVRQYDMAGKTFLDMFIMDGQLVLMDNREQTGLMTLSGPEGEQSCDADLGLQLPQHSGYQALQDGFVYYNPETNQAVFLDLRLQRTDSVSLPKDLEGTPLFSPDGNTVFYCVGQQIRAYDMDNKLQRLVKSHTCEKQTLLDIYLEGKLISCRTEDASGNTQVIYISTETGQTVAMGDVLKKLWTCGDNFFALHMDGVVERKLFGKSGDKAKELSLYTGQMEAVLELESVLQWVRSSEGKLELSLYNLKSGKKNAGVTIENAGTPKQFLADGKNGCIWMLLESDNGDVLLRWDVKAQASAVKGGSSYISAMRTEKAPDETGLEACQKRVDKLNKKYDVQIRIWKSAAKYPKGYKLKAEYQVPAINQCLDKIEAVLKKMPENFLYKSAKTKIRICIVRSIDGKVDATQCWYDKDAFMVLSSGVDIEAELLKGIGGVLDVHVLGNSSRFDYWYKTLPEGFAFGEENTYSDSFLTGEGRAFVDKESMESAPVDRSHIFWQAMLADNAEMFKPKLMQSKLKTLCRGIREAWDWEDETQVFPWEQYLSKPLAPTK
ncbi:MAG: hypothetical protein J6Q92_05815 [Oscillospiraceae bacterium]|nr:hypothetical protein [Oscillospiraceae bacterium]